MSMLLRALFHVLGLDDASGAFYLFWSGFFADTVIFVAAAAWYWRHTCHVGRCWRWGRLPAPGSAYTVCHRHHPDGPPTHAHILSLHRRHIEHASERPSP